MNQRDVYTHELISAYRDGELSPDELARVEQLLASSAVHRQTLEEIKSLGGEIHALPAYRLDDRFPQRVLEKSRQVDPTIAVTSDAWTCPTRQKPAGIRRWQVVISLSLAAAATVLMALFLAVGKKDAGHGDRQNWRSVAKADVPPPVVSRPQEPRSPERDQRMSDVAVQPATDQPAANAVRSAAVPRVQVSQDVVPNARQAIPSANVGELTQPAPVAHPESVQGKHNSMVADSQNPAAPQVSATAAEANSPGASISAASTLSPVEPASDAAKEMVVPFLGTQNILLVIDVELTLAGAEEGSFERALNAFGIAFDTNIDVKPDLENALLKSRFFEPAKELQDRSGKVPLQLVYVVAQGGAIDDLWQYMKQNDAQFARVTLDMAIKPGDMAVFQQLQRLADSPAVPVADPSETEAASERHASVAHRLVLPPSWNGAPVATAPGHGGLSGLLPDLPKSQTPRLGMGGEIRSDLKPGLDGGTSPGLRGGKIHTEALIVVRRAGDQ